MKHSQPSWDEIKVMARISGISLKSVTPICGRMLKDILTEKTSDLTQFKDVIVGYRRSHNGAEPFEGLPREGRVQMERIREALGENRQLLEPVTSQIRELLTVDSGDKKIQKQYTVCGFFVALLGILFATYAYFRPRELNH